jgi:hypothetical protein
MKRDTELLRNINRRTVTPALRLLPKAMDTPEARVLLLAICLQESGGIHRWQVIDRLHPERKGPARGLWQFELGSRQSRGGVWGVFLHPASRFWLWGVSEALEVPFGARAIWQRLEIEDVLACCVARLLIFTDPIRLPAITAADDAWDLYRRRTWRPGKPKKLTWVANHRAAVSALSEGF